jgi:hypothetical protein
MVEDWRREVLETLPYLRGLSFVRKPYRQYRPGWDHDYCAVCGAKLAEPGFEGEDTLHEGYGTTSEYEHGADYEWICHECFAASKDAMGWKDATQPDP